MIDENTELVIRASTGRFEGYSKVSDVLSVERIKIIQETLKFGTISLLADITMVPLRIGDLTIGLIFLDRQVIQHHDHFTFR